MCMVYHIIDNVVPSAVAFTASLRGGGRIDIGDNTPIKFNGYSSHTGFFTAPVAGTYGFYLTVKGANIPEVVHVGIYKSGRILTRTEARGTAKDIYDKGSCFAITHLNVGDRVHARRISDGTSIDKWYTTAFSGFLITAD
ncbi:hypothetical protein BaRGS_00034920 [Batillaria attramentaria]|uniref:C1q domain-containing protein n=1 Tax=Batillaria attramentaria TaxID=370345 RepID=A0ABD0JFU0_9CAEN